MLTRAVKEIEYGRYEWVFGAGFSSYKKEQYSIEQDIRSALLEWKNDAFWALQNGIDYKTRLGNHNQRDLLDADVQRVIEGRYGVLLVQNFQSNVIDRYYTCSCEVLTIYSEIPIIIEFSNKI